jgi:hypothetical protein
MRASDFAGIISALAPGTTVYFNTWRGGEWFQRALIVGSSKCPAPTARSKTNKTSANWTQRWSD